MRRAILIAILAASIPAVAIDDPGSDQITYEIVAVQGKLFLEVEPEAHRLTAGDQAVSGDRLRTGSSSSSTIGVPSHTTVFRIDAKTSCTLAHDRPGVLLHLEKGRLRAIFGNTTGTDPRLVTTPTAVLAVRGTDYGVRVKKNGNTHVVVFEGVVEITDPAGENPPIRVEAGQETRARVGRPVEAPSTHRLTRTDWDQGRNAPAPGAMGSGMHEGSGAGSFGSGAGSGASGSGSKRRGG
jgi:hypothetical protein